MCSKRLAVSSANSARVVGVQTLGGALTRSRQRFVHAATTLARCASSATSAAPDAAEDEALDGRVLVLRLPDASVVGPERHAVDDGARLFGRGKPVLAQDPGDGLAADLARAPGDRCGRRAQAVGIPVRTHAADGDPVGFERVSRVQEGDSAALALELPVLDQVFDPPVDQPVELLAGRLELDRLRDGEGQDVRGNLRRRCFDDVDLHGRARMLSEQVRTVFLE